MPTYKVAGTDILHNTKLYPDGSTIELTKSDADRLADYLEFINVLIKNKIISSLKQKKPGK